MVRVFEHLVADGLGYCVDELLVVQETVCQDVDVNLNFNVVDRLAIPSSFALHYLTVTLTE